MVIKVETQDIKGATRRSCTYCPVVRAIKRQFPNARYLEVRDSVEIITTENEVLRFRISAEVRDKITHFDRYGGMKPFDFELGEPFDGCAK